jgi:hypothetical protein
VLRVATHVNVVVFDRISTRSSGYAGGLALPSAAALVITALGAVEGALGINTLRSFASTIGSAALVDVLAGLTSVYPHG